MRAMTVSIWDMLRPCQLLMSPLNCTWPLNALLMWVMSSVFHSGIVPYMAVYELLVHMPPTAL